MKKLKFWLTGLLFAQLLLAIALLFFNQWEEQKSKPKPILAIDWNNVDKLIVEDNDSDVTLTKTENTWVLSNTKLPIKQDDIQELLKSLEMLQTSWPVATLKSSHKRFEVVKDKFVRRIQIFSKDKLVEELFFGSSPGLRQSHVRRVGDDAIYSVDLDTLDINANSEMWIDTSFLATGSDISLIKGPDYSLKRPGASWEFNQSGPSIFLGSSRHGKLDQAKVEAFASFLSNLEIISVAQYKPVLTSDDTTKVKLEITDEKGSWTYLFVNVGDAYFVSRNDQSDMFILDQDVYESIANVTQADLLVDKPKSDDEANEEAVSSSD
jgi:hypothetical protein